VRKRTVHRGVFPNGKTEPYSVGKFLPTQPDTVMGQFVQNGQTQLEYELLTRVNTLSFKHHRLKKQVLRCEAQNTGGIGMCLQAQRKLGEMLGEQEWNKGAAQIQTPSHGVTPLPTHEDLGITRMQSHRWQKNDQKGDRGLRSKLERSEIPVADSIRSKLERMEIPIVVAHHWQNKSEVHAILNSNSGNEGLTVHRGVFPNGKTEPSFVTGIAVNQSSVHRRLQRELL